jgi:hypothetical protein
MNTKFLSENLKDVAKDRDYWQVLANKVMNLQVP